MRTGHQRANPPSHTGEMGGIACSAFRQSSGLRFHAALDRLADKATGISRTARYGAKPRQSQGVGVGLAVDQQQVGLDVAFAVARPIAGKIVVAVSHIQG